MLARLILIIYLLLSKAEPHILFRESLNYSRATGKKIDKN